ncbi:MAG: TonB-dependent receptor [Gemmatimonadota bacterium]
MRPARLLLISFLAVSAAGAQSDSVRTVRPDTVVRGLAVVKVIGRADQLLGVASTASEGFVGSADLRLRPIVREGELLETVPGLIVTQHSGEGKANQLFVRGFNLDHGTDFQTKVEGMPVNLPSHAHGQGYTDLNFLIPELVDHVDYRLGVYHTEIGDFGSAGGAEFRLMRSLDQPFFSLSAGANGFARAVGATQFNGSAGRLLVGGEARGYDGPWQVEQKLRKRSALARYTREWSGSRLSVLALGYDNSWNASDQIPRRSVPSITRFGQVDPTLGGDADRYSLSAEWDRRRGTSSQGIQLFGIRSTLDLYSNFTYFLENQDEGDQFNQRERRSIVGINAWHKQQVTGMGAGHLLTFGLQNRADFVGDVGLHRSRERTRVSTVREDDVTSSATGLFVEAQSFWKSWLRTETGVRGDFFSFDVRADDRVNSGSTTAAIASPRASIVVAPFNETEVYLSGGLGFHSNDARGTTITRDPNTGEHAERVDPVVRSRGVEVGARTSVLSGLRSTLSLWSLRLDSELLFVGDGGTTEPIGGSRRTGVTLANWFRPVPSLILDADVSFARARLAAGGNANRIPGAMERVIAGGATWTRSKSGLHGAIRLRHFGAYPLIEDNSVRAQASTLVNGDFGVPIGRVSLRVSLLNVFNARANDIQYYYTSRLRGEPVGGIEDVHFHPAEPRQLRVALSTGR